MGSKTRLSSYCTKRANNGVNIVTSRKMNTRLARPITTCADVIISCVLPGFLFVIVEVDDKMEATSFSILKMTQNNSVNPLEMC